MAVKNVVLGTSETEIIKAGTTLKMAVLSIIFCNTSSASVTITVYCYPSTGSASDGTTIVKQLSIAPLDTYVWTSNEKFVLAPNDKISALASATSSVTATANYMEMGS